MSDNMLFQRTFGFPIPEQAYAATWKGLHESRSKVKKAMDGLLDICVKDSRELTDNEKRAFDCGYSILDSINEEMEFREKVGNKEPRTPDLNDRAVIEIGNSQATESRFETGFIGKRYREIFPTVRMDFGEYGSAENFFRVASGMGGALEKRTMVSKIGVMGGFTVPGYLADQIFSLALENSICLPRVRVFPMKGAELTIPEWDSADHTKGPIGGFRTYWLGENQTATKVTPRLRTVKLSAVKCAAYLDASREIVQDGIGMAEQIGAVLKSSLSYAIDDVVVNGNGVAKPTGILHIDSRIALNRVSAGDITYTDLVNMITRLIPSLVKDAIWICSPAAYAKLLLMVDTAGAFIWKPASYQGAAAPPPQSILGLPLFVSEKAQNLGTEGDLILVNLGAYAMGWREEIVLETSNAPGWSEDLVSFRVIARLDGHALLAEPVTPANGGNTLSWAITLN